MKRAQAITRGLGSARKVFAPTRLPWRAYERAIGRWGRCQYPSVLSCCSCSWRRRSTRMLQGAPANCSRRCNCSVQPIQGTAHTPQAGQRLTPPSSLSPPCLSRFGDCGDLNGIFKSPSKKTHWLPVYYFFILYRKCKFLISLPVQNVLPVCLKLGSVSVQNYTGCRYIAFSFCTGKCKFLISLPVQNVMPVCLKSGSVPVQK